jgi:PadR family transcriptional regulator, regulatory protein AphA
MSNEQLSPTSYLVLGLLAREGPSTPYDLKRHVARTLGHFWSFPHAMLYAEPARLAALGMCSETQEEDGRRRRVFTLTDAGSEALQTWLRLPSRAPTELRDPGLLQLFFADMGSETAQGDIADQQLIIHRAKLSSYLADEATGPAPERIGSGHLSVDQWRGQGLRMGLLYERAAVDFWEGMALDAVVAAVPGGALGPPVA